MNMTGQIGEFIVKYQNHIEICAIALAVIILLVVMVKIMKNAKKKRELLSNINDTISEINSAVGSFGQKKAEVIYIDNRVPGDIAAQRRSDLSEVMKAAGDVVAHNGEASEPDSFAEDRCGKEPPKKYFSRDCATSKTGRTYTEEELEDQIRE